jgi:hypothetical protein
MTKRTTRAIRGLGELSYDMRQPCGLPFERFRTKLRFKDGYEWIAFRKNEHGEDVPGRPSAATIARQLSRAKRWLFAEYQQSCEPYRVAGPSRANCAPVCDPEKSKPCGDACVPLDARCKTRRKSACSFEEAFGRFEAPPASSGDADDDFDFSDDAEPFTLFGLGGPRCPHAKRFHQLTNMTPAQIRAWAKDPRSKLASNASTRARLPKLAALKAKPVEKWTPADCKFAARVVSFNGRMDGMRKEHGCTTKIDVALRNWGRRAPGCQTPKARAGRMKA